MTSNLAITVKNEKKTNGRQIIQRGIRGTQGAFTNKITPDIDGCTDEPVFPCDVRIVKNYFVDDWNDTNYK